jgi:hypothetical protein
MSIINKLINAFKATDTSINISPTTDSFADNLILEFRRAVNETVMTELEKCQEKYLSNILRHSHFPVEAISIVPCDHEIAKSLDEFFRIHAELDKNFEQNFFTSNLPKEYRTSKGAKAILKPGITFSILPSKLGIDNPTPDEKYQINLRGNRKKFISLIELGKITADEIDNPEISSVTKSKYMASDESILPTPESITITSEKTSKTKIFIQLRDKHGEHLVTATLPVILGRTSQLDSDSLYEKINIDSTYISRNQFVIIEVQGTVYGFIPKEAKLTAIIGRRGTLRPLSLIEIETQGLYMVFGQPLDTANTIVNPENPDLYPSVTIKLGDNLAHETMTPVPHVRK